MCSGSTDDQASVRTIAILFTGQLTVDSPTHDHIERLQAKLDDLEGYLENLRTLTGSEVTASLQKWKRDGELDGVPGPSSRPQSLPRPSHHGQDDDTAHEELLNFESPMGGEYIYDRDG